MFTRNLTMKLKANSAAEPVALDSFKRDALDLEEHLRDPLEDTLR